MLGLSPVEKGRILKDLKLRCLGHALGGVFFFFF